MSVELVAWERTYNTLFLEISLNKAYIEYNPQAHIHAIRQHQTYSTDPCNSQEVVRRTCKADEECAHSEGLVVQILVASSGSDECLGDAVDGEERDVIAVHR